MAAKALLIDNTRCIGCRACQVACKSWNELPAEQTQFFSGPGYQNPRDLSDRTWTFINYNEVEVDGRFEWVFGRQLCMHCNEPACAVACPVAALVKTPEGPVVYATDRCIGCRYCMLACPFQVPKFEWDAAFPVISKCTMCSDRVQAGLEPACSKVCPTDAVEFGERDALVSEAERRIRTYPRDYVNHVYGRDEVGGTSVLHLSKVPFDKVGYRTDLPKKSLVEYTRTAMQAIPGVIVGLTIALGAVYGIVQRRIQLQQKEREAIGEIDGARDRDQGD